MKFKRGFWFYIDWFMVVLLIYLFALAFPTLEKWAWGYTSQEWQTSFMLGIAYLAVRANLKK